MRALFTALLCGLLVLPACGEDAGDTPSGPDPVVRAARPPVSVPAVPLMDRARFALERLRKGPERTAAILRVPSMHPASLTIAQADLIAMPRTTLELLDDDALIAAMTGPSARDYNPWLGVMTVLMAIETKPAELTIRWTAPALERPREIALLRRAVRTLTTVHDPAVAPTALAFLRAAADDRIVAPEIVQHIALMGSPWRERAIETVIRHSGPFTWRKIPGQVTRRASRTRVDPAQDDALTWAAQLMEGAGPRPAAGTPREKKPAWSAARVWTDPSILRLNRTADDGSKHRMVAFGVLPVETAYGAGWLTSDVSRAGILPGAALYLTGREPAAELRCYLATSGWAPYQASRDAEKAESYKAIDAPVYYAALHCMAAGMQDEDRSAEYRKRVRELLPKAIGRDNPGGEGVPTPPEVQRLLRGMGDPNDPEVREILERILRELRPFQAWRIVVELAHDLLIGAGVISERNIGVMIELMEGDAEDRGVALHLMRRARMPFYVPFLEQALGEGRESEAPALWRTLMFTYSTVSGIEPAKIMAFVGRAEAWIRDVVVPKEGPARAASLATGLLDFGDPGGEAFARFLQGPHRVAFAQALGGRDGVLPLSVAAELLRPLDRKTAPEELRAVMVIAWRQFPADATGHLAALERVCPKSIRPLVTAAKERVRHRGPRVRR